MWHLLDPNEREGGNAADIWSGIAWAAEEKGDMDLGKIARNITFSLRTSVIRLRDISCEYARQNLYAVLNKKPPGSRFMNVETFDFYVALHSFLAEMCSARDYLAQFIGKYILGGDGTRMSRLYRRLKQNPSSHPVGKLVLSICDRDKDGWMSRLGRFRDMTIHEAPIRNVARSKFLAVKGIDARKTTLLKIYFGIPKDPFLASTGTDIDALVHFRELALRMLRFARSIAASSPVECRTAEIRAEDL
jgi:hypothetical protein